jgi:hypothetical protein
VFRWVEHTSELDLELESTTVEALFEEALGALNELIGNDGRLTGSTTSHLSREVEIQADDRPALLAAWLATSTTRSTSLYASGASSASPLFEGERTAIPRRSSSRRCRAGRSGRSSRSARATRRRQGLRAITVGRSTGEADRLR